MAVLIFTTTKRHYLKCVMKGLEKTKDPLIDKKMTVLEVNLIHANLFTLQIWILAAIKMARDSRVAKKLPRIRKAQGRIRPVQVNHMDEVRQLRQQARAAAENQDKKMFPLISCIICNLKFV